MAAVLRGLILYCARENLPLDFVSWHEYFQEASMIAEEARAFRGYLADQPRLAKSVRSFMITEWNEAWWADRPHDHELARPGAQDGIVRACCRRRSTGHAFSTSNKMT